MSLCLNEIQSTALFRQALIKEGWEITDDPYVISYGERFLFIDLAAGLNDPERDLYLAVSDTTFNEIFSEPIGDLVVRELSLKLLIVDVEIIEVKQWILP